MKPKLSPLLVILGPTGTGKSELGLFLAERFAGEIVNCDSVQVYRRLDIGSAKTPLRERRGIRHWLIDIIDPDQELSAGGYARLARQVISEIHARGRIPIVVGGTGFYLKALIEGLSPAPGRDEQLRSRLAKTAGRRPGALHRFLQARDPEAAARIHPQDHQKMIRAIELTIVKRQPASRTQALPRDAIRGVEILKIGLAPERSLLYQRLNERSAWLFAHGLITETQHLLDLGYPANLKPLQSLGYKQAAKFLAQELSDVEAIRECQTRTRQYAKRQMTWFRGETDVNWLHGFGSDEAVQNRAADLVKTFLGG